MCDVGSWVWLLCWCGVSCFPEDVSDARHDVWLIEDEDDVKRFVFYDASDDVFDDRVRAERCFSWDVDCLLSNFGVHVDDGDVCLRDFF